jgi:phage shock protein PspC (stress-responsive transcriptional regulator)
MGAESTKEDTMTTNHESPRPEAAIFTSIRGWGITRGEHGVLGGVVEGVGERIGLDRVPARIIAVVLAFATSGLFLVAYAAAWGLLPDRSGRIIVQDLGRGTPNVGALIGIGILTLIGTGSSGNNWSHFGNGRFFPFGLIWTLIPLGILVGVIVLVVALVSRTSKDSRLPGVYAVPPQRASAAAAPGSATFATTPGATAAAKPSKAARAAAASAAQESSTATPADGVPADAAVPPATPSVPPPPPRPRTPGPGSAIYLLTLSAAVFAAAAIWLLDREGRLAVSPVVAWLAVAVVIIGGAIILTGAAGRRIGFLGFLATTFIIGWIIGLALVPRVFDFADGGATITIDGISHTIGNGHGWFDQDADGVACGSYDLPRNEIAGAPRYVVEPGQTSVTVTSETAVIVVAKDSSLTFRSEGIVDGSLSIQDRNVTCTLNRAQGDLYSVLRTGDTVTVNIASTAATIAIEEN